MWTEMFSRPAEASAARAEAGRVLRAAHVAQADDLTLVVSELVTNAVTHGLPPMGIAVEITPEKVRVSVHDASPAWPEVLPPDPGRIGGRGMHIVDQLATAWGVTPRAEGKVVWFEHARSGPG